MLIKKAARRYAQAFFDLAKDSGCQDKALGDMVDLGRALRESTDLAGFLGDYVVGRQARGRALEHLFQGRVDPLTWRFIRFLESKKRLGLLREVCPAFEALHDKAMGILQVMFACAFGMEEQAPDRISKMLEGKFGRPVKLSVVVRPELIGGFRLQVEDRVHDFSVAGALAALRRTMV